MFPDLVLSMCYDCVFQVSATYFANMFVLFVIWVGVCLINREWRLSLVKCFFVIVITHYICFFSDIQYLSILYKYKFF